MKLHPRQGNHRRARHSGFTLVEVLAALLFMAIVIPVAMQGLSVASRAGELANRRYLATLVADEVLNEAITLTNWIQAGLTGKNRQGPLEFDWTLRSEPWLQDRNLNSIRLLSVEVAFEAQGQQQQLRLSTLVDENAGDTLTNLATTF